MSFTPHPAVHRLVAVVVAGGGPEAVVERVRSTTWTLRWTTDRVVAGTTVTVRANGRSDVHGGVLEIDGVPCPPVHGTTELLRVFADPDTHLVATVKPLPELPPPVPWEEVPDWLAAQVSDLPDEIPQDAFTATRVDGRWVLAMIVGGNELRVFFGCRHPGHSPKPVEGWAIAVDGVDCTWRYADSLEEALTALTAPKAGMGAAGSGAVTGAAAGARDNAVETRRASVYRI